MSKTVSQRGPSAWDPAHPAVVKEVDASTGQTVSLEHVMHPYPDATGELWDATSGTKALFVIAWKYVVGVATLLEISQDWLDDLSAHNIVDDRVQLRWHPMEPGDPRNSFRIRRRVKDASGSYRSTDLSFVLIASLTIRDTYLHNGQALRVAGTLKATDVRGRYLVRITGALTTLPRQLAEKAFQGFVPVLQMAVWQSSILSSFGLGSDAAVADFGVKLLDHSPTGLWDIELRCDVVRPDPGSDISYRLIGRTGTGSKSSVEIEPIARIPLTSDIAASLFEQDPITKLGAEEYAALRPNKSSKVLNGAKTPNVQIGPLPKGSSNKQVLLTDPVSDYVRVTNSALVASESRLPGDDPKEVSRTALNASDVRTDTFASINAYHHARDLFQRLTRFGLVPEDIFKFASLPLLVRYRSGIEPGPGKDGRLINAQARWTPTSASLSHFLPGSLIVVTPDGDIPVTSGSAKVIGNGEVRIVQGGVVYEVYGAVVIVRDIADTEVKTGIAMAVQDGVQVVEAPGQLEVCFALADLQSSSREAPEGAPLGVACDPRWNWHEFSHVLLAAATGELEFSFAHSAGDALGAILFDPESRLSGNAYFRGISFPWVCWPCRRHDRSVEDGWSWTGPLYHQERYFPNGLLTMKKAYWSEQILSSSLFRLYRSLGGDSRRHSGSKTIGDIQARRAASDYTAMLVMRAIQSMGPASAATFLNIEKFVIALMEADAATGTFATTIPSLRRIGGVAHKAIRWAFEQQGLYGGSPPSVDVFIDDLRKGGYEPLSMIDDSWHSTADAIAFEDAQGHPVLGDIPSANGDVNLFVTVENRGSVASSPVSVRVDLAPMQKKIPDWLDPSWVSISAAFQAGPVQPGGKLRIGPLVWKMPKRGRYAVFAAATCAEDPSTIDAASGLPCSTLSGPMPFLIAGDNNLGLRVKKVV